MKVRNGFVSNSSSSSFVCYGALLDPSDEIEILFNGLKEDGLIPSTENFSEDEIYTALETISKAIGLECSSINYNYYLGRTYTTAKDEETFGSFKKSIAEKLEKYLPGVACCHIEQSSYEG